MSLFGPLPIVVNSGQEDETSSAESIAYAEGGGKISAVTEEFGNISDEDYELALKKLRFGIDGTPLIATPRRGLLAPKPKTVAAATINDTPKARGGRTGVVAKRGPGAIRRQLKVCGPASIRTLRGRLHGREVSLVLCGETHEDAVDLTRCGAVMKPEEGWGEEHVVPGSPGFDPADAVAKKANLSVKTAKKWAEDVLLDHMEDEGATLVFEPLDSMPGNGIARVFLPNVARRPDHPFPDRVTVFVWEEDGDDEARAFNKSRSQKDRSLRPSVEEQDKLIARRKGRCMRDGVELFDDWLLRQAESKSVHVELVLEAPVSADEVELHVEQGMAPAPQAHQCLRQLDPDSDEDVDDAGLGGGSFLDYLRRRAALHMKPERVHCIDPRNLGDADDENLPHALRGSFDSIASGALPKDAEQHELEARGAQNAARSSEDAHLQLPSWEAFFGGAADLLYYAHHVKADYSPFLSRCVGSPEKLQRFFQSLYFGTVPDALREIRLNEETRPFAHIRSLFQQPPNSKEKHHRMSKHCHSGRRTCAVRAAPVDCFLKARGFNPPRTWLAGIADRLRQAGADRFLSAASKWYTKSVNRLLADPKHGDLEGDNFAAWLRACHKDIYKDIDHHDPCKLRRKAWAQSERKMVIRDKKLKKLKEKYVIGYVKQHKDYNLKAKRIPSVDAAFKEFQALRLSQGGRSTCREQVLSKIVVDSFALRSVDLAMALQTADIALSAPRDTPVVVVLYAGLDHTRNVVRFFRSQGFKPTGLPNNGLVGKDTPYGEEERRSLKLPVYLQNLDRLFPLPKSLPDMTVKQTAPQAMRRGAVGAGGKKCNRQHDTMEGLRARITRKRHPVQLPTIA